MAVSFDVSSTAAILKELYGTGLPVEFLAYKDRPFLAMLAKEEEMGGKYVPVPTIVNDGAGDSMDFSTAQAGQQAADNVQFRVTGKTFHGVATLTGDAVASAQKEGPKAFVEAIKLAVDTRINSVANAVSTHLFGTGTGTIGKSVSGTITSGAITLTDPNQIVHFSKGMTLNATDTDGGTATGAAGYVVSVNRAAGTLVVSTSQGGAGTTPASWSGTNFPFLVAKGNLNAQGPGLNGYLPSTAPSSGESFLTIDRSIDSRLYGVPFNAAGVPIEEALIDASALVFREGGSPDIFITNPMTIAKLDKALGSKVHYVDLTGPAGISFRAIEVNTGKGTIRCLGDRDSATTDGYLLEMKSWKLFSAGKVPRFNTEDSGGVLQFIPVSNADSAELRIVARLVALACNAPGHNARLYNLGT
jgi:hypothetical protein